MSLKLEIEELRCKYQRMIFAISLSIIDDKCRKVLHIRKHFISSHNRENRALDISSNFSNSVRKFSVNLIFVFRPRIRLVPI